jgi:hypothetical protein
VASSMTPCTSAKPVRLLVESRAATAGDSTNRDFFLQKRRKKAWNGWIGWIYDDQTLW